MRNLTNHHGFTLIELAIIMIVIGVLVGFGAGVTGPLVTFIKVRETKELQDSTTQSIISWAASRNAIPNSTGFPTVSASPKDAWSRNFVYKYYSSLSPASPTKDTICGLRSTTLTLQTTDPAATIANVAFVVLSGAENATLKSTLDGAVITASGKASGTITATGPNSDLIRWVTLDELRSKVGCQGAPLKIVNNELPYGNYSSLYSAALMVDGGSGTGNQWRIKGSFPSGFPTVSPFVNSTTWKTAPFMNISGHPSPQGSYSFSVYVRDDIGNNSSKTFVLTVNPRSR